MPDAPDQPCGPEDAPDRIQHAGATYVRGDVAYIEVVEAKNMAADETAARCLRAINASKDSVAEITRLRTALRQFAAGREPNDTGAQRKWKIAREALGDG